MRPCYGLAEATLLVSAGHWDEHRTHEAARVGVGPAVAGLHVAIVDPSTGTEVAPGEPGEVWVSGDTVAQGYWSEPAATQEAFDARLAGKTWLRTGDLGMMRGGELVLLDRLKDLIIVRGANHYAHDLEAIAESCHPLIRTHGVAAFGAPLDGEERLVLVCEVERSVAARAETAEEICSRVQVGLAAHAQLTSHDVVLVRQGTIPRTSSGKIRRRACREAYLAGEIERVGPAPVATEAVDIRTIVARALSVRPADVPPDRAIGSLGLDSLRIFQAKLAIERLLGVELSFSSLLDMTPNELAALEPTGVVTPDLPAPAEEVSAPLSPGQRALLYMYELRPNDNAYTIARAIRLTGPLDIDRLTTAVRQVAARHQALRLTIAFDGDEPRQRFTGGVLCESAPWDADHLAQLTRAPFDLRNGPLVAMHVFRRAADEHVLLFRAHHLAVDLWSLALLLDELEQAYRGTLLTDAPARQFAEVVAWQQALLNGPAGQRLSDFWFDRLKARLDVLALPTVRAGSRQGAGQGAGKQTFHVDLPTTTALRAVARACGSTLTTVVIAACQILLARFSGQRRFLMGTLASGRTRAELQDVIGYCVNLIALRVHLHPSEPFDAFLRRTRTELTTALDHQDLPFSAIIERLRPQRAGDRSPLIRAVCVCQPASIRQGRDLHALVLNQSGAAMPFADLRMEPFEIDDVGVQFDLSCIVTETPDGLSGAWHYDAAQLGAEDVAAMAHSFCTLLQAIATQPRQAVGDLPLVSEEAFRSEAARWNNTSRRFDETSCVHEVIARQAAQRPHATALIHRSRAWTSEELMQRVRGCAAALRRAGVGPEVRVAICLERSLELVAALLGVSMAGGAYVPLDPNHPRDRLHGIIRAAAPAVIITSPSLASQVESGSIPLLYVDTLCETPLDEDDDEVPRVHPDNALYIMFTSGSTGTPKGVVVSHRQVMNLFAGMDDAVGCGPDDTLIAVTSVAFDISVVELLWTLARGARVVVADDLKTPRRTPRPRNRDLAFSLFYFADSDSGETSGRPRRYDLLLDGARFADAHGFAAVWTPERHFHSFGGLYPNPSVTSAALATITSRIALRAGSVVLPLHHPIRVAEEWSLVDNLSGGRAGVAFASGWHAEDFAFCPDDYPARKAIMLERIEIVRALWRGESIAVRGGDGGDRRVRLFPRPIQPALPIWLTAAGSPETFEQAGHLSANVLTHLLGQTLEALRDKIDRYTRVLRDRQLDPQTFDVTLMLHAYVDETDDRVMAHASEPFARYLRSSLDLVRRLITALNLDLDLDRLAPADLDDLIAFAARRYMSTSGLFGTPRACLDIIDHLVDLGVTEVACLVDFGIERDATLAGIARLADLRDRWNARSEPEDYSIAAQAARTGATMIQCTPSMLAMLLGSASTKACLGAMRVVLVGGEPLPIGLLADLGFPGRVMNMYGPTETTVWSAAKATPRDVDRVTIGGPLANTQIYMLDASARPVPDEVIGEVWIGGAGVARGYWQDPALTAARFRPDPFSASPGARLYRTGDVGRRQRDGSIDLLGRSDQQVKLRGYRVELGDVEAALNTLPGVRVAVAVKHHDAQRGDELVAYVVPDDAARFDVTRARAALHEMLPAYMVPGVIVSTASLPVNANNKIDRRRLAGRAVSPETSAASSRPMVEPSTTWETRVRQIWQQALGVDVRSVDDNFFDVGGHSLLMARVHEQLQREAGRPFPLLVLLERPTIRGVADFLARGAPAAPDDVLTRATDQQRAFHAWRQAAGAAADRHPA